MKMPFRIPESYEKNLNFGRVLRELYSIPSETCQRDKLLQLFTSSLFQKPRVLHPTKMLSLYSLHSMRETAAHLKTYSPGANVSNGIHLFMAFLQIRMATFAHACIQRIWRERLFCCNQRVEKI